MPVLKSLAFTAMPKAASDPVHIWRAKFIEKLKEHKLLLMDPAYFQAKLDALRVQEKAHTHEGEAIAAAGGGSPWSK